MAEGESQSINWKEIEKNVMGKYHGNMADQDKDQKFSRYLAALGDPKEMPKGQNIGRAIELMEKCPDKRVQAIARMIKTQRYIIVFGEEGGNQGAFDENTNEEVSGLVVVKDPKTGEPLKDPQTGEIITKKFLRRTDGVIRIDTKAMNCPLAIAGILAHEMRHAMDNEQKLNGLLPDASGDNNDRIRQFRADIFAGFVLKKLGYAKGDYSAEQVAAKASDWGDSWHDDMMSSRQESKITMLDKFEAFFKYMNRKGVKIENLYQLGDKRSELRQELRPFLEAFFKTPNGLQWDSVDKSDFPEFFKTLRGATKCGRPCKDPKLSPCDRMRIFPPCEDH